MSTLIERLDALRAARIAVMEDIKHNVESEEIPGGMVMVQRYIMQDLLQRAREVIE